MIKLFFIAFYTIFSTFSKIDVEIWNFFMYPFHLIPRLYIMKIIYSERYPSIVNFCSLPPHSFLNNFEPLQRNFVKQFFWRHARHGVGSICIFKVEGWDSYVLYYPFKIHAPKLYFYPKLYFFYLVVRGVFLGRSMAKYLTAIVFIMPWSEHPKMLSSVVWTLITILKCLAFFLPCQLFLEMEEFDLVI